MTTLASFSRNSTARKFDGSVVGINTPRYEKGVFGKAILLEPATTNYASSPTDYNSMFWGKLDSTPTVLLGVIGPEGNNINANKLVEGVQLNNHGLYQSGVKNPSPQNWSMTIYAKAAERTALRLRFGNATYYQFDVNLLDGVVSNPVIIGFNSCSNVVDHVGNGWYRITLSTQTDTDPTRQMLIYMLSGTNVVYQGNGVSGVWLYTAQLEFDLSSTSFTDVARVADYLTIPATIVNPNEGTICCWAKMLSTPISYAPIWASYPSGGLANMIGLYKTPAINRFTIYYGNGTASQPESTPTLVKSLSEWNHVVLTYKTGEPYKLYVNGALVLTTVFAALPHVFGPLFHIGNQGTGYVMGGLIDDFKVFPKVLPDSDINAIYKRGV